MSSLGFKNQLVIAGIAATVMGAAAPAIADRSATSVVNRSDSIELVPMKPNVGHELRIQRPDGTLAVENFLPGEVPAWPFDAGSGLPADGLYTFEVRQVRTTPPFRADARANRAGSAEGTEKKSTGYFTVRDGRILPFESRERNYGKAAAKTTVLATDDGVVRNSLCVGFDCPDSPSFGSDTIRLQENVLRIDFTDTSVDAFPKEDWVLAANESGSGGLNAFWIQADGPTGGGERIFLVEAGAPSSSLYVDSTGRVGLGTAAPALEMHAVEGDTPGIRIEQDGSSGFNPQTWDVAGNETSFFVRDVTNGSTLPFRIRPGAPSNALAIESTGNVGVGTLSASKQLEIRGTSADQLGQNNTMLKLTNASGTEAPRRMVELINNGSPLLVYRNTADGSIWNMSPVGSKFVISLTGTGAQEFEVDGGGNVTIQGSLTENSKRSSKRRFTNVDTETVLAKLEQLPIEEWSYKHTPNSRHVGPMAADFHAAFGLGPNDGIAPRDLAGVALAAAKALKAENEELKKKVAELDALKKRLEVLEAKMAER